MINRKTVFGKMSANIILVLMYFISIVLYFLPISCYFAWIIPFIIYIVETKNKFVRDHSSQAVLLFFMGAIFSASVYLLKIFFTPVSSISDVTFYGIKLFIYGLVNVIYILGSVFIVLFSFIAAVRIYGYNEYSIIFLEKYIDKFRKILDKIAGDSYFEEELVVEDNSSNIIIGKLISNSKYKDKKDGVKNAK